MSEEDKESQEENISRRKFGKVLGLGTATGAGMLIFGDNAAATTIDPNYLSLDSGDDIRLGSNDEFEIRYNSTQGRVEMVHDSGQVVWYVDEADGSSMIINGVDVTSHSTRHEQGGSDEISVQGLSGTLADDQYVGVLQSGTDQGSASQLNFTNGSIGVSGGTADVSISTGRDFQNRTVEIPVGQSSTTFFMDSSTTSMYRRTQLSGSVYKFREIDTLFASPSNEPRGVGVDSNDCIWNADQSNGRIYGLDKSGSVVTQFNSPGNDFPRGVGVDSNDSIWAADEEAYSIFQLNQSGSVVTQFASPSAGARGVGVDSNDSIWHADTFSNCIYQLDQSGSVVTEFFEFGAWGVGVDSNDCIWSANTDGNINRLNQSGSVVTQFASPSAGPKGLGVDSNDSIWHADSDAYSIYKFDQSGSIIYSDTVGDKLVDAKSESTIVLDADGKFASPSPGPTGVGVDSSDCIWNADANSVSIHQLDQTGSVVTQFASPSTLPQGVGVDSSGCIWNADSWVGSIYRLNQSGSVVTQFASPSSDPTGVGVDSSDCIWHVDSDAGSIYRLNQSGSVVTQFASPSSDPTGVGVDSSDCIWNSDYTAECIHQLDQTGSVVTQFASPSYAPKGVGVDSSGCIWNSDSSESIFHLDQTGTVTEMTSTSIVNIVSSRTSSQIYLSGDYSGKNVSLIKANPSVDRAEVIFKS